MRGRATIAPHALWILHEEFVNICVSNMKTTAKKDAEERGVRDVWSNAWLGGEDKANAPWMKGRY